MAHEDPQLRRSYGVLEDLATRMLVVLLLAWTCPVHGQGRLDTDSRSLATKAVSELGGKLRYADEFTSGMHFAYPYPNVNPLDEYLNMNLSGLAKLSRESPSGKTLLASSSRQIVQIDLSGTRPTDEEIAGLASFPHLRVLLLNGAVLSDKSLLHLAQLRELEVLDISSTQVTGAGLRHLAALTRLIELHLIETKADDDGLRWLAGMKDLEVLSLCGTLVGDRGLERLTANPKIRALRISKAAASDEGVSRFRRTHPQCRVFHTYWLDPQEPPPERTESTGENLAIGSSLNEQMPSLSADTFSRNHPIVTRVFGWNSWVVAECQVPVPTASKESESGKTEGRFYIIDVNAARSAPLHLPSSDEVLKLATVGQSESVALCLRQGKRILCRKERDKCIVCSLPDQALHSTALHSTILAMEGGDRDLVLLTSGEFLWRRDGRWSVKNHTGGDKFLKRPVSGGFQHLVADGALYRAIARGEFGGGLYRLELATGMWSPAKSEKVASPVSDVKVDSQGHLWAVEGLSHLSSIEGGVWVKQSDGWNSVISIDHFQRRKIGWNLGYDEPQAIAFDPDGRRYVVASHYGICRYEGRCWKPLIRPWPGDGEASLYLVDSKIAVVGTYRSGVLLCNLDTGSVRQVLLVRPDASR